MCMPQNRSWLMATSTRHPGPHVVPLLHAPPPSVPFTFIPNLIPNQGPGCLPIHNQHNLDLRSQQLEQSRGSAGPQSHLKGENWGLRKERDPCCQGLLSTPHSHCRVSPPDLPSTADSVADSSFLSPALADFHLLLLGCRQKQVARRAKTWDRV